DNQADYIVITHPDFRESLEPLIVWRKSGGLEVKVVTIEEVYDEFSYGLADPTAIRDFLRYANQHWARPAPRYVLLVGDASYDYRDNLQAPHKNLLPTYLVQTHFVGETASDNWFVDLDDDSLPDMAIGRLPVKSAAETRIVVDKTIDYERNPTPGEWRGRVLFVADDDQPAFEATSDALIESYLPPDYQATRVYLSAFADPEESTARIVEEINQGAAVVSYVGHAALNVWAKEGMFSSADITALRNESNLPFFVTMTCLDGYFHHPQADCLAEELLLAEGKGAVACLAPTSESLPSDQDVLAKALFEALFAGDAPTLGEAVMRAKRSLPDGGRGYEDLIKTYTLLGDPALRLTQP
ncbi:MAG: C25 family cysteine peptidase, partial [Anaerolineae bacterium]